jgi:hypothetical protein
MSPKWPLAPSLALLALLAPLASSALVGCADEIGDECETALDCSQSGSRACDRTQPGGYCTIRGCERGTCPEEAVCVKFRPEAERLAVTYCMFECEDNGDCRDDEGYHCTSMGMLGNGMEAEVLDGAKKKFCSAEPREPISLPDGGDTATAGSSSADAAPPNAATPDAAMPDAATPDAATLDAATTDAALPMSLPDGG